mgnify:CR=1 FL=1
MRKGIAAAPFLVKPNRGELEKTAGHALADAADMVACGRELAASGVEVVVVSLGSEGA